MSTIISIDNYLQISRTADGSHIFYSWADSDTAQVNGGIGFGQSENIAPNLRIAGKRISDGYVTCPKWVTSGDFFWSDRALWPTMAPEVLTDNSGSETLYKLPVVITSMLQGDPLEPCQFWYLGNDATLTESDFWGEAEWVNTDDCFNNPTVSVEETNEMEKIKLFPVPSNGNVWLTLLNPDYQNTVEVYNNHGQPVYTDAVRGTSQTELNLSGLSGGYYSVRVISDNGMVVKPLIIAH